MSESIPFVDVESMTRETAEQADRAWRSLLSRGDFVRGDAVHTFEARWAEYCESSHAVGVANGTDAIWLTLLALGIGPGDEVVVPANTFIATVEAIIHCGATPRFADVDPATLLLDAAALSAAITPRVRAAIVVHLYGRMPDMDAITHVTQAAGIALVEDAAQAHGARWKGRRAGSFGIAGCFSFYPGKNLGAFGDAGAVVTSDRELAAVIRSLGDHGRFEGTRHRHVLIGANSRIDTIQAAVLSAKLDHLERWNAARRAIHERYRELLPDIAFVSDIDGSQPSMHLEVIKVPDRARIRRALFEAGIATAVHYPYPCHVLQPYEQYQGVPLPVAEEAATRILSLPMFPHMTSEQVDRVASVLQAASQSMAMTGHG